MKQGAVLYGTLPQYQNRSSTIPAGYSMSLFSWNTKTGIPMDLGFTYVNNARYDPSGNLANLGN